MKNVTLKIWTSIFVTCAILSCESNVEEDTTTAPTPSTPSTGETTPTDPSTETPNTTPITATPTISFSKDIKPIIDTRCVECHGGTRFPDVRTYASIARNAASIKDAVVNRRMPRGGVLPNNQINLIRDWIDNGALNN